MKTPAQKIQMKRYALKGLLSSIEARCENICNDKLNHTTVIEKIALRSMEKIAKDLLKNFSCSANLTKKVGK